MNASASGFWANNSSHAVLVLGAKVRHGRPSRVLTQRLRLALTQPPPLVVSGAGEAAAMRRWLKEHGYEQVIEEPKATNTYENLFYTQQLLPEVTHWTIVTSDFHVPRARLLAQRLGMEARVLGAPTPPRRLVRHLPREIVAWVLTLVAIMPALHRPG